MKEKDRPTYADAGGNNQTREMKPGDEAPEGTYGAGDAVCEACKGTGKQGRSPCSHCRGTGTVTEGIGGA
jgi:DnaJ-class molecular chaperone